MQQGYQFILRGSSLLSIASSAPSGTLYQNDVTLNVVTSGGAETGKAWCQYREQHAGGGFIDFLTSGSAQHTQPLTDLLRGTYHYDIHCEDIAGNTATTIISFTVDVDTHAPQIQQIYAVGDAVYVVTDETSTCAYHTSNPDFAFDEGTVFGTDTTVHVIPQASPVSYVQCRDAFGNTLSGVTIYL